MLRETMRAFERETIARALYAAGHNRTHAAAALGISRRTLLNKIRDYRLTREAVRLAAGGPSPDQLPLACTITYPEPPRSGRLPT